MKYTDAQLTLEFKRRLSVRQTFYSQIGFHYKKSYQNLKVSGVIKRDKALHVEAGKKETHCNTSSLSQNIIILGQLRC